MELAEVPGVARGIRKNTLEEKSHFEEKIDFKKKIIYFLAMEEID